MNTSASAAAQQRGQQSAPPIGPSSLQGGADQQRRDEAEREGAPSPNSSHAAFSSRKQQLAQSATAAPVVANSSSVTASATASSFGGANFARVIGRIREKSYSSASHENRGDGGGAPPSAYPTINGNVSTNTTVLRSKSTSCVVAPPVSLLPCGSGGDAYAELLESGAGRSLRGTLTAGPPPPRLGLGVGDSADAAASHPYAARPKSAASSMSAAAVSQVIASSCPRESSNALLPLGRFGEGPAHPSTLRGAAVGTRDATPPAESYSNDARQRGGAPLRCGDGGITCEISASPPMEAPARAGSQNHLVHSRSFSRGSAHASLSGHAMAGSDTFASGVSGLASTTQAAAAAFASAAATPSSAEFVPPSRYASSLAQYASAERGLTPTPTAAAILSATFLAAAANNACSIAAPRRVGDDSNFSCDDGQQQQRAPSGSTANGQHGHVVQRVANNFASSRGRLTQHVQQQQQQQHLDPHGESHAQ